METLPLCPAPAELRLDHLVLASDGVTVAATARRPTARCPLCGHPASRVHSRYTRTLADLPWHGLQVRVKAQLRKFCCDRPGCPRRIFTERIVHTAAPRWTSCSMGRLRNRA